MHIKDVLRAMVQLRSSDLFLKVDSPPRVRVDGAVRQLGTVAMSSDDMRNASCIQLKTCKAPELGRLV